jgi:hypothetical protein
LAGIDDFIVLEYFLKIKDNSLILSNGVWHSHGVRLMRWFTENMPEHEYKIEFSRDEKGNIIYYHSVHFLFDSHESIMLFNILGYEEWRYLSGEDS